MEESWTGAGGPLLALFFPDGEFRAWSPPDARCCFSFSSSMRQSLSPKCWSILASFPLRNGSGYRWRERSAWRAQGRRELIKLGVMDHQALLEPVTSNSWDSPFETQSACGALCWLPRPATRSANERRAGWGKQAGDASGPSGPAPP